MPTAPDLIAGKEDKAKTSRRTSENFCASDTDVTLVSCDNVLFHVHRKNLEVVAGGFPPSGFDTYGEEVPLTEDAATLELLFQFAYPRRHPDLKDVSIKTLERLAEAVEKYEFFSAMNICKMRMHHVLPKHPVEVANYASKHGYVDILVDVPPFLLDIPLDEVAKSLHPAFLAPWICYREAGWSRAVFKGLTTIPAPYRSSSTKRLFCPTCDPTCKIYPRSGDGFQHLELWARLGDKRSRESLGALCSSPVEDDCSHIKPLRERIEEELSKVPSFDTFLQFMMYAEPPSALDQRSSM